MKNILNAITLLLLITIWSGCGGGGQQQEEAASEVAEIGVTDSTITIGSWGPLTGPAALWGSIPKAMDAYFSYINEQGGIHGRKIKFVYKDDGYQPAKTVAVVREMVEQDEVFAFVGGVGTAPCMAVMDYIVENNIPWITPTSGATHWAYPAKNNIFSMFPLYFDESATQIEYLVNELGMTKIAMIYQNDDFGKSGLVGAQITLRKYDLEFVETVSTELTDADLSSHCARLKESGAEAVIMQLTPRQAAITLGTSTVMGYSPQWIANSALSDATLMHQITEGRWEGVIFTGFSDIYDTTIVNIPEYQAALQKYYPDLRWSTFPAAGMAFAEPLTEALKIAGPDLTREKFIAAMESLEDFQGIALPASFGPGKRQGVRGVYMYKCLGPTQYETIKEYEQSDIDIDAAIAELNSM
jgi:ABC-type branched-subunit amino acid transport system substrate-binding protein